MSATIRGAPLPIGVRVCLAHAAVQVIAEQIGARVLHIKGPAVDPTLGRRPGPSTDADVLVAPADVLRLTSALQAHGWQRRSRFETGSPFEHAANYWHRHLGFVDVHRHFPGIGAAPDVAFERLWAGRHTQQIATLDCPVPSRCAQALLLTLHAARGEGASRARQDVQAVWRRLDPGEQAQVRALAGQLQARAPLSVALGEIGGPADAAQTRLWRSYAGPATPRQRWLARLWVARGRQRWRLLARAVLVNVDHLELTLGRPATRSDIAREALARVGRLLSRRR